MGSQPSEGSRTVREVTELRARVAELSREREEHLRLMADAGIGIWSWDVIADQVEWTSGLKEMFAADPRVVADFIGLVHPDDRASIGQQVEEILAGKRTRFAAVYRFVRADGKMVWADTRGEGVRDESGKVRRMRGTMVDVTVRKRGEEALRTSEAKFQAIIENTPNVAIQGYDGDGRVVFWNRASEQMFGWSADEAIGRRLDEFLLGPEDAAAFRARLCESSNDGQPRGPDEFTVMQKDGTKACCLSTVFAVPATEGLVVCMDVDITARKRAEEALLAATRVESIGRLAGSVAHDFNNMLTAILGYAELIEQTLRPDSEAGVALEELRRAAERGARLTAQLLAFGRTKVTPTRSVDVQAVVRGVSGLLRRLIGDRVELSTRLAPDTGTARIDAGELEQVLVNLAVNARDAMPEGGVLTIETGRTPGGRVRIVVSDTGHGMSPEVQKHVFEPFFTTKGPGRGTGLGLPTCERIVSSAGGRIVVASEPGKGSRFEVLLPAAPPPPADAVATPAPKPTGRQEMVLLVEDDAAIREMIQRALESAGYRVLVASDGAAACALAEQRATAGERDIDVLVTDLVMPKMGGHALARRLLARSPKLAVLFTSGYGDRPLEHDAELARARSAYLQKPFRLAELGEAVRRLLDEPA